MDLPAFEIVDDALAAILRAKTPAERLRMALEANRFARRVLAGSIKTRHPDWSAPAIDAEVARRMLDAARTAPGLRH